MTSKWVQQVAIEDVTYAPDLNAAPSPGCADSVVVGPMTVGLTILVRAWE